MKRKLLIKPPGKHPPLWKRLMPKVKKVLVVGFIYSLLHLAVFAAYIAISIYTSPAYADRPGVFGFENFTGSGRDNKVQLSWTVKVTYLPEGDPLGGISPSTYKLLRNDVTAGDFMTASYDTIKEFTLNSSLKETRVSEQFIDTDVKPGHRYKYALKATDFKMEYVTVAVSAAGYDPGGGGGTLQEKGTAFEKLLAGPMEGLYEAMQLAKFKSYEELLFNKSDESDSNSSKVALVPYLQPFTQEEWDKLFYWYKALAAGSFGIAFIGICLIPWKLTKSALNPMEQVRLMDELWRWLLCIGILLAAPIFIKVMFLLNTGLTNVIYAISTGAGTSFMNGNDFFNNIITGNVLLTAFVKLSYMLLLVYLNFLFTMRKFILATFFVATMIMAFLWAMNNNGPAAGIWVGEVISNAFMGSSYALVFCIWNSLLANQEWWVIIFGLTIMSPIAEALRNCLQGFSRFFGVNEQKSASMAAAGFGGMMGVLSFGKAAFGGGGGGGYSGGGIPGSSMVGGHQGTGGAPLFNPSSQVQGQQSNMHIPSFNNPVSNMAMAGASGAGASVISGGMGLGTEGNQAGNQAGTPTGRPLNTQQSNSLSRANSFARAAGRVGTVAGKALFTAAMSPVASMAPQAAKDVADMGGKVTGGIARMSATGAYLMGDTVKRVASGQPLHEALHDMSGGAQNPGAAIANLAGSVVKSAVSDSPLRARTVNTQGLDHFRWK